MQGRTCILKPRLDITFKPGPVPGERGPLPPIRTYWQKFVDRVQEKIHCDVIEEPLWNFTDDYVSLLTDYSTVFIPHRHRHEFPKSSKIKNLNFYMQTVFPHLFSVDPVGWGNTASCFPIGNEKKFETHKGFFENLQSRIEKNESKFEQPDRDYKWNYVNYWLFACQIPHDLSIQHHSRIKVEEALQLTIDLARLASQKSVIVKGHPVNPGSMNRVIEICNKNSDICQYVEHVSIHDAIANCDKFFTVNSGTGIEAMLHLKPIFIYGFSEYMNFVGNLDENQGRNLGILQTYDVGVFQEDGKYQILNVKELYSQFLYKFVNVCFDVN